MCLVQGLLSHLVPVQFLVTAENPLNTLAHSQNSISLEEDTPLYTSSILGLIWFTHRGHAQELFFWGAGEMAQQLRALTALLKVLSSNLQIPATTWGNEI